MFHGILKDVLPFIEVNAPLIASSLGYPGFTKTTKWAIDLISKAFGTNDMSEIPAAIQEDSQSANKLKDLDDTFKGMVLSDTPHNNVSQAEINIKLTFNNENDKATQ